MQADKLSLWMAVWMSGMAACSSPNSARVIPAGSLAHDDGAVASNAAGKSGAADAHVSADAAAGRDASASAPDARVTGDAAVHPNAMDAAADAGGMGMP